MDSTSAVNDLLAQMRATSEAMGLRHNQSQKVDAQQPPAVDFSQVLKSSLDEVAVAQKSSKEMQEAFVLGEDKVTLSDTLIEMQKSSVKFQMALQVRNKMVQAYSDIMNMQV